MSGKPDDVYGQIIADCQRSNAISEMDLHECVKVAQRALVFLESGRPMQAMQAAGVLAGIAQNAARRIEVAQANRHVALRLMETIRGERS